MIGITRTLILTIAALTSACTTLEDFQNMSPSARANKTCNDDVTVRHYRYQVNNLTSQINEIDALLLKGYRVRESCTTITYDNDSSKTPKQSSKKICQEVVIPLNDHIYNLEKERRLNLSQELESATIRKKNSFNDCYQKVLPMSAEQAFTRFDN